MVSLRFVKEKQEHVLFADEICVPAVLESLVPVQQFLVEQVVRFGGNEKLRRQILLVTDELFANIVNYGYPDEPGKVDVRVQIEVVDSPDETINQENSDSLRIVATFSDDGIPFNPLEADAPDIGAVSEARMQGGYGILLVRKNTDDIEYQYADEKNVLTFSMVFSPANDI